MYCPRCSNQPSSDRVRFCPSCGFRLDGVAELIARDGVPTNILSAPPVNLPQGSEKSERRLGIRRGAKMVFFSMAIFLPVFGFCFVVDGPAPLILPGSIFLTGIFWMLYYRLFGSESVPAQQSQPVYFGPPPQQAYFPQQPSAPSYRSPIETPQEHSVAEHTTRSLGRQ